MKRETLVRPQRYIRKNLVRHLIDSRETLGRHQRVTSKTLERHHRDSIH